MVTHALLRTYPVNIEEVRPRHNTVDLDIYISRDLQCVSDEQTSRPMTETPSGRLLSRYYISNARYDNEIYLQTEKGETGTTSLASESSQTLSPTEIKMRNSHNHLDNVGVVEELQRVFVSAPVPKLYYRLR